MQFLELTYLHSLSQSGSNSGLQKRVGNALGAELEQLFSRDSLALKAVKVSIRCVGFDGRVWAVSLEICGLPGGKGE